MAYLTDIQLKVMGFKYLGLGVKISDRASIYNANQMEIGHYSRIDDFCVVSGKVAIGRNVHITPNCLVAGGEPGLVIEDFCTFAYGVMIFTQSDDYSGTTMTNSTIPKRYKAGVKQPVLIRRHVIVGAGSVIFPGVTLNEGTSVGAMSLIRKSTEEWSVYVGNPAVKIKKRKKNLLELEKQFLEGFVK